MIHDVDESLRNLIGSGVADPAGVDVTFEAPTKDWASRRTGPAINVFLYDIREDVGRRDTVAQPIYNEDGRMVGRKPPPRRFRLAYLITAWTQRPEDEHRLLAALLTYLLAFDKVPDEHLSGGLTDIGVPVLTTLALPPPQDRSLSDIWSALGGELKPSLDYVVVTPVDPSREVEVGPPVQERDVRIHQHAPYELPLPLVGAPSEVDDMR